MEEEIDLRELLHEFWTKKYIIIIVILASIVLGVGYSYFFTEPQYKSKATIILTKNNSDDNTTITQTDVTLNQQLVNTYTELIKTNNILGQVLGEIGDNSVSQDELRNSINVKLVTNTQLIEVSVTNKNPEMAKELTNKICQIFVAQMKEKFKIENLSVLDEAKQESVPYNINHKKDILMFAVAGTVASFAIVFFMSFISSSIKSSEELEKQLKLTGLANIPNYENNNSKEKLELVIHEDPKSPIAEVFRMLRTNLQFMTSNKDMKTLLVTSSSAGEGKSFITSNLAISFANENKKVLLIDSDMRKGRLHSIFSINKTPGLANYLSGITTIEDKDNINEYIQTTQIENISIMSSGDTPPNPSELLETDKLKELIEKAKEEFDIIIFDGTPCLLVTDSLIIAKQVQSTVLVGRYKKTKISEIEKTKKSIANVNGRLIGFVINKTPFSKKTYNNSYYYGHKEEKKESN